jgi:hypothetical protein
MSRGTQWEVVIGLETHTQLSTASKIFSGASTNFGAPPNTNACAVDIALPGVLPVLNKAAVEHAIRFGLAVGGSIAPRSIFARKNYFYPDLPKGYQISQYEIPVVSGGSLTFFVGDEEKTVRLTRAHLEDMLLLLPVTELPAAMVQEPKPALTSTALALRYWKSFRNPTCDLRWKQWPTPRSCMRWCSGFISVTAICRKEIFVAMQMCRCAVRARHLARGARSRT